MTHASPLPSYLVQRYQEWQATAPAESKATMRHLADHGQTPQAMVISCCDSRVLATTLFGADVGDFFMHRNIANIVPPCDQKTGNHGTEAALEYAVTVLKVSHLVIIGHAKCGGVAGAYDLCAGNAPALDPDTSFVGRWISTLRPAFDTVKGTGTRETEIAALEQAGVINSLENVMTYPFVQDAVASGALTLHGLWTDIGDGTMLCYDGDGFNPIG